jgi:hypothetical protein
VGLGVPDVRLRVPHRLDEGGDVVLRGFFSQREALHV